MNIWTSSLLKTWARAPVSVAAPYVTSIAPLHGSGMRKSTMLERFRNGEYCSRLTVLCITKAFGSYLMDLATVMK